MQSAHILPNFEYGETTAVRTGFEKILAHHNSEIFSAVATGSGTVVNVDDKTSTLTVKYDDVETDYLRDEKVPYSAIQIDDYHRKDQRLGFVVPAEQIDDYPAGAILRLSRSTNGIVMERIRCTDIGQVPNYEGSKQQAGLLRKLQLKQVDAVYFIGLELTGIYTPGKTQTYDFSETLTNNSGSYVLQRRKPNVKVGEKVVLGDVLVYNEGFFKPEYGSKQVLFNNGVMALVAMMEKSTNLEDASELSPDFAQKMTTYPTHVRTLTITEDTTIENLVALGTDVESVDPLCELISADVALLGGSASSEYLDLARSIGRSAPKADYYGVVKDIKVLYSGSKDKMSDSVRSILKAYERRVRAREKALDVPNEERIREPGKVLPGTKYHGIDFTDTTVVIEIAITGTLDMAPGDKLCLGNANKSVTSFVSEKPAFTESGLPVDIIFSTKSVEARIVNSPYDGLAERNVEYATELALADYFS